MGLAFVLGPISGALGTDLPQYFDFCGEGGSRRFIRVVMDHATKDPWNVVLSNVSLNSASPETMQAIDELKAVSKNLCHEFGLPVYEELEAA